MAAKKRAAPKKADTPEAPKTKKARTRKPKTSSAPGEAAHAHQWLMQNVRQEGNFDVIPGDAPEEVVKEFFTPSSEANVKPPRNPADHLVAHRIQPGQVLNPNGRKKGSRNKLGEQFIADLQADWEQYGPDTILRVRAEDPSTYLKVIAGILPKQVDVRVSEIDEMTDDQLDRRIKQLAADLLAFGQNPQPVAN